MRRNITVSRSRILNYKYGFESNSPVVGSKSNSRPVPGYNKSGDSDAEEPRREIGKAAGRRGRQKTQKGTKGEGLTHKSRTGVGREGGYGRGTAEQWTREKKRTRGKSG